MHPVETDIVVLEAVGAKLTALPAIIKLAPRGRFIARDGRSFNVDPEALVARFEAHGIDVAVDIDHATVKKAMFGEAAPAVGWIGKLIARADGLYGSVSWLAEGARTLAARTHRYISPSLQVDPDGNAQWLHSVALVATPALPMAAIASAGGGLPTGAPTLPAQPPLVTLGSTDMRVITPALLEATFRAFNTSFNQGFEGAESYKDVVAMTTKSSTTEETYGWMGVFPKLREWIGDRHVHGLKAHGFTIKNRLFESTAAVERTQIEDDKLGLFTPIFTEIGRTTRVHPDALIFELLKAGFERNCYDGQFFFDTDHPTGGADGLAVASVSNVQAGASEPWFLLDCSRAIKPIVWQERIPYNFTAITEETNDRVFFRDEYVYGVRARVNAGFGLWQLAYGSKATLNADNLRAAYTAMRLFKNDNGGPLGIRPTHLVVGSGNFFTARDILLADTIDGTSNTNRNLIELISPDQL